MGLGKGIGISFFIYYLLLSFASCGQGSYSIMMSVGAFWRLGYSLLGGEEAGVAVFGFSFLSLPFYFSSTEAVDFSYLLLSSS